jgi:hypothetical protein
VNNPVASAETSNGRNSRIEGINLCMDFCTEANCFLLHKICLETWKNGLTAF